MPILTVILQPDVDLTTPFFLVSLTEIKVSISFP